MAIAIVQLCIYNGLPGAQGEQLAHYFEFAFAPRISRKEVIVEKNNHSHASRSKKSSCE